MKFKNTTCLKKVWVNKADTSMDEYEIIFNESKLVLEDNKLVVDIKEREVLFLSNSEKIQKESVGKKPEFDIVINDVDCYYNEYVEKELSGGPINVLIITKSIYDAMKEIFKTDREIFEEIYKEGITQISTNLVSVKDFCAITCSIVEEI